MHCSQRSVGGLAERHASVLLAKSDAELEQAYDKWAALYDEDLAALGNGQGNVSGLRTSAVLQLHATPETHPRIVDFGCGTGAAGPVLHAAGWRALTGVDLSAGMLAEAAKRGVYTELRKAALPGSGLDAGAFDVVHAAGLFAPGQAPPSAFDEFVRVLRPGGLAFFTIRCCYHDSEEGAAHAEAIRRLEADGRWAQVARTTEPYLPAEGVEAYVFVMKKEERA